MSTLRFVSRFYRRARVALVVAVLAALFVQLLHAAAGGSTLRADLAIEPAPVPGIQTGSPAPASAAQESTGTISGTVFGDDGHPLIGAQVMVARQGASDRQPLYPSVVTDSTGAFKIPNLAAGKYSVSATARGYVPEPTGSRHAGAPSSHIVQVGETVSIMLKKGGVITGKVTAEDGEPVVDVRVIAETYRDRSGRVVPGRSSGAAGSELTDDRGIYRIYGLNEGSYLIKVGRDRHFASRPSSYDENAPFYYQSGRREGAQEVPVRLGQEVSGIDVRYQAIHGFSISGVVSADLPAPAGNSYSNISLMDTRTAARVDSSACDWEEGQCRFKFTGVPDGEYEIFASRGIQGEDDGAHSDPVHVQVAGSDVAGLTLRMVSQGSVAGKIVLDPTLPGASAPCPARGMDKLGMVLLRMVPERYAQWPSDRPFPGANNTPSGEFAVRALPPEKYFIAARLSPPFYVKSVTTPSATAQGKPISIGRLGLILKPGQRVAAVLVTISAGAAHLQGRVVSANPGLRLPEDLLVIAVPKEIGANDDPLRFAETRVREKGEYLMANLAPGRYLLVTRTVPPSDSVNAGLPQLIWDATERAKLRRESAASGTEVVVGPCEAAKAPAVVFRPSETK